MLGSKRQSWSRVVVVSVAMAAGVTGLLPVTTQAQADDVTTTTSAAVESSTSTEPPQPSEPSVPPTSSTEPEVSGPDESEVLPSDPVGSEAETTTTGVPTTVPESDSSIVSSETEPLVAAPEDAASIAPTMMLMAAAPPTCTVILKLGAPWMPGNRCLEERLAELGSFTGTPDDFFTAETGNAVLHYQVNNGVYPSGRPDLPTLTSLGIWSSPPAANCAVRVELGAAWMPGTVCLEQRLAQLGLFGGVPDQLFGNDTAVGVSLFQQSEGLSNTARADRSTLNALGIWSDPGAASCSVAVALGAPWIPGTRCLEQRLATLGLFAGSPDDLFGHDTAVGVSLYQQSAGLPNTSLADPMTLLSLGIWHRPAPTCSVNIALGPQWMPQNKCLEQRLADLGLFSGAPDEVIEYPTQVALSHFQQSVGLPNTARPDSATLSALGIRSTPPAVPCTVASAATAAAPSTATCLQRRLTQLGLYSGSPSGVFDTATAMGVSFFQQSAGLPATSVADARTSRVLGILNDPNALPANSGSGRRIVYSRPQQRLWAVNADGSVAKTHAVSGRRYEPYAGTYSVYSRSLYTNSIDDPSVRWMYMVRFTYGPGGGRIGFHEIPNRNGVPLQSAQQLGLPLSSGCVRQSTPDALWIWNWAPVGTRVVVL